MFQAIPNNLVYFLANGERWNMRRTHLVHVDTTTHSPNSMLSYQYKTLARRYLRIIEGSIRIRSFMLSSVTLLECIRTVGSRCQLRAPHHTFDTVLNTARDDWQSLRGTCGLTSEGCSVKQQPELNVRRLTHRSEHGGRLRCKANSRSQSPRRAVSIRR